VPPTTTARESNAYRLAELRQAVKPFRLHFFTTLRSTSDHAAAMRRRGDLYAPAIVLAARQTAGRGRGTNTWFSAAGSITATFVLPVNATLAPHHLPLAAGLAVRDAAAEVAGNPDVRLKWPNDLVYATPTGKHGRGALPPFQKLAGLLCERLDQVDLIGLGLNVNPPAKRLPADLAPRVTFLQNLVPPDTGHLDLTTVLATVARHLHRLLIRQTDTPFPTVLRQYDLHHALVGRSLAVYATAEPPVVGRCEGLDSTGRLLVRTKAGVRKIIAGHVELR